MFRPVGMNKKEVIQWELENKSFIADEVYRGIGECMCTVRPLNNDGYVQVKYQGRLQYLHRLAYEVAYNESAEGCCVLHICDTPCCFNPEHLYLGDRKMNRQENIQKGRGGGNIKTTEEEVRAIKTLYFELNMSRKDLADVFSYPYSRVDDILRGRAWNHI